MESKGVLYVSYQDDESWTAIHLKGEQKEMMQQIYEIPAPEDNGRFLYRLVVGVPKTKGIITR